MFWFVKTVHYYSAGPENKIGLSYVNVVCVYGGRGGGWGLEVLKMFCQRGQNFFYLLCVCVCVCVVARFSTSPSVKKIITDPPPINKWLVPITKSPQGHYVAYLFFKILLVIISFIL